MIQQQAHSSPLPLVCVAAPEDASLLDRWETHLRPLEQAGLISVWSPLHLEGGDLCEQELRHHLEHAHLILLLLSVDFFKSPDCRAMMELALERSQASTVRVIPLLLRPVTWQESSLKDLAPWPPNGKPIVQWSDQDDGWHTCAQELRRLLGRRVSEALSSEHPQKHADPDWEHMLRRLRRSYKELLDQSLHGIAWVELGLSTRPDLVSNVTTTHFLFRLPQGGERLLAPGASILDVYDEAEGELLILGAPGAGKSTFLLKLAQQLVGRAFADSGHPLPVILRLSSWAVKQPALADWMAEQLSRTYAVPRQLSERWVKQGQLLPLLDGLDEVEETARPACIDAINSYHQTHLNPLVVCSRQAEYEGAVQKERLALQSAVIVQPLSDEQIEKYLSTAGPAFAGVRTALSQEQALQGLATTPLMLSVLLLTYRDTSVEDITHQGTDLERQIWTDYVKRQVQEKGNDTHYPLERTSVWLTFLAGQMRVHQQTTFYAEYLDTDWLSFKQQRTATVLVTYLPALLTGSCVILLILAFLGSGSVVDLIQWGLVGGSIGICVCQYLAGKLPQRASRSLGLAALFGALLAVSQTLYFSSGHSYSFGDWVWDGCLFGLGGGLSLWLFQIFLSHSLDYSEQRKNKRTFWQKDLFQWLVSSAPAPVWRAAAWMGGGMGLSSGLSSGLTYGLSNGLGVGLIFGLSNGLGVGLSISVTVVLIYVILRSSMGSLRLVERISWEWRRVLQRGHLRTGLTIMGMLFLFIGLNSGLSYGLSKGLGVGLIYGLSLGLSLGLNTGLSYLVLVGLYRGITQEHLEDQNRQQFNQGVRHSLRKGLLMALSSTIIITILGVLREGLSNGLGEELFNGLSNGLFNGLSEGLVNGLIYGLSFWQVFFSASLVITWALFGGLTVLRHYVIRWLLARHRTFPWRAQAFLDDATTRILLRRVGGGYSFIHRRLQDYFADEAVSPPQK